MGRREIRVQTVAATEARQKFGQLIKQVYNRESRAIIAKGGTPVVAIVSLGDFERWTRMDREREERFSLLDEIRGRNQDKSSEEIERDVADEIDALRREPRA